MNRFTLTPEFLEASTFDKSDDLYLNVLMVFAQDNKYKLCMDNLGFASELYEEIIKKDDSLRLWLSAVNTRSNNIEKVIINDEDYKDKRDLFLSIADTTPPFKHLVTYSKSLFNDKQEIVTRNGISLLDGNDVKDIFRYQKDKSYNDINASKIIEELIGQEPLSLKAKDNSLEAVLYIARQICLQFKKMVETNRMSELLYYNNKFKNEKAVQRLFLMMADGYCRISDIALSPETDYGAGPVDFKFSSGYHSKVLLEMKLARNSQLMHGIEVQLPVYLKAESTSIGIYMIVIADDHDEKLVNSFWEKVNTQNIPEALTDNIIVIDARKRASASKL